MSVLSNFFLLVLAFGLVLLNGFFVAAEFALVRLRHTRVRELRARRGWRGRILGEVHQRLDTYLSACQLGITLASLGLGWVGEPAFAHLLEPLLGHIGIADPDTVRSVAFVAAFSAISFLHIVAGELAPKSLALIRTEGVSLWTAVPLYLFYWLTYPAIRSLNVSANAVLRLVGLEPGTGHDSSYSHDELRLILHRSHAEGEEDPSRVSTMLAHTLDLRELEASDLMRSRREMVTLQTDHNHAEVRRIIQKHRYSRYPLLDERGAILGIVHVKDVLLEPPGPDYAARLRRLVHEVERVREDLPAMELLRRFRQGAPHFALVLDASFDVAGFLTLEDVLEAMVGEITDEHEQRRTGQVQRRIIRLPDNSRLLRGDTPLYRLEREIGMSLDQTPQEGGGATTVGGLLMQRLDRVPARGDALDLAGWRMVVQRMKGPQVELVKLVPRQRNAA